MGYQDLWMFKSLTQNGIIFAYDLSVTLLYGSVENLFIYLFIFGVRMEPKPLCMLGKCSPLSTLPALLNSLNHL
jgi:hypothetical protein